MATQFNTPHNDAFKQLGAIEPGRGWSAFDVKREQARQGQAERFVTTIWNFHRTPDEDEKSQTRYESAIVKDESDGSLWYRVGNPKSQSKKNQSPPKKTAVAHWRGIQLALKEGIRIIGVLKDAHSDKCSLQHVFDCDNPRYVSDGSALWLQLHPHGDVGCEVRTETAMWASPESIEQWDQRFGHSVERALECDASERDRRLRETPPTPERTYVIATVFKRNPDVVAAILVRAAGNCETCEQPAPFLRRTNQTPYLEVHHKHRLADGGVDIVENAMALCPNCHREAHHG